jgi:hypothetical protein
MLSKGVSETNFRDVDLVKWEATEEVRGNLAETQSPRQSYSKQYQSVDENDGIETVLPSCSTVPEVTSTSSTRIGGASGGVGSAEVVGHPLLV